MPLTDVREFLVVEQLICWPAEVLAVQGHQEQGQTHDVKHLWQASTSRDMSEMEHTIMSILMW
jgi:hypothetical protein